MHDIFTGKTHRREPHCYIGKVAKITGASCKAIRYYESLGLLPTARRRGKYRVYSERDIFLIHMIKHTQPFGFSLMELKELVSAAAKEDRFPLQLANAVFERKQATLRNEIDTLQNLEQRLADLKDEMNHIFN